MRGVERAGLVALLAVGVGSAIVALLDLVKFAGLLVAQLQGQAQGTDFLNLYAGAYLTLHSPSAVYDLDRQLAVQQGLTGWASPIVPFYLPPHAAVLLSWLALLPYAIAYLVWLLIGIGCLIGSALLLAPRRPLVWAVGALLFLPALLALVQGQTTPLMLLGFAVLCRSFRLPWLLALAVVVWTLKPQLAIWLVVWLLLERRFGVLVRAGALVAVLSIAALVLMGPDGVAEYAKVTQAKLAESFTAEPTFLPGPTLLHATRWYFGDRLVVWVALWVAAVGAFLLTRRRYALVPILAVIASPYALVHELMLWLAPLWLLAGCQRRDRATLLWLVAAIWLVADLGVAEPLWGGDAAAALLGLVAMWLVRGYPVIPRAISWMK